MPKNSSSIPIAMLCMLSVVWLGACNTFPGHEDKSNPEINTEPAALEVLQTHLDAVASHNLETLKNTLSPNGEMHLILPGSEITHTTEAFLDMHREWFLDTTWTFEPTILLSELGDNVGFAMVEVLYKEPDRNGKPYFNRMAITYGLKKIEGRWYVVSDQACSMAKSE